MDAAVSVPVPINFGWVVITGAASIFTSVMLGRRVEAARKKYGVEYPNMYDNTKPLFNASQRGHQNMLESHYAFLWTMTLSGLEYPRLASACGVAWTIGRIVYALGYETGDPKKRLYGTAIIAPSYIFCAGLLFAFAAKTLGYIE